MATYATKHSGMDQIELFKGCFFTWSILEDLVSYLTLRRIYLTVAFSSSASDCNKSSRKKIFSQRVTHINNRAKMKNNKSREKNVT